ncbi:hypothetical protein [Micromonospora sp. NBRC 101691]|uniref:hypothetical protein n=1 Tax=Micromonospora sp. NBRC 101691 TaxID=3032198 RepID=UPI00255215B8|nr:hypothetical protein [Micromonospora sp. NBRC 101691]
MAQNPVAPGRPLLNIETHLWVRAVSRLLRGTSHQPMFGWYGEAPREPDPYAPAADVVVSDNRYPRLPAIYCRHCGRSGWMALSPEQDPQELEIDPDKIYRASVGRDKRRIRALVAATGDEIRQRPAGLPEGGFRARVPARGREVPVRVRRGHRPGQLVPGLVTPLPRRGPRCHRQLPQSTAARPGGRRHRRDR